MTLPQLLGKLKKFLLYEITPRRPAEPWSKRGPNISLSVRPKLGRDHRLLDNDVKYLTRDNHLL